MWIIRGAVLLSALFVSNSAWASFMTITESPTSVVFNCGVFDAGSGFSVDGTAVPGCYPLNSSGGVTLNEPAGNTSFTGEWYYGPGMTFTGASNTVYFVDMYNEVTSILTYTETNDPDADNGYITGSLQFDNSGFETLGTPPGGATVVQDGTDYTMASNPYFAGEVDTSVDPVPEPASIALLLSGLFGLRMIRRRKV